MKKKKNPLTLSQEGAAQVHFCSLKYKQRKYLFKGTLMVPLRCSSTTAPLSEAIKDVTLESTTTLMNIYPLTP